MKPASELRPLWAPTPDQVESSQLIQFMRANPTFPKGGYADLHRFSCDDPEQFWSSVWDFSNLIGDRGQSVLDGPLKFMDSTWFPKARINYAENLLTSWVEQEQPALIYRDETGARQSISGTELNERVARVAGALHALGITSGDRVAAMLPNNIDTCVLMLATTKLGGVWSSCSPDFAASAAVDRFKQIQPRLLFGCRGYHYNGKFHDCSHRLVEVRAALDKRVDAHYAAEFVASANGAEPFDGWVRQRFDAPLYIMFSSGTTGVPKCMVHSIGGTLIQHQKEHRLHCDFKQGDRVFFYTTCGWMMWNWLVSVLACGATACLWDGAPFSPNSHALLDYIEDETITHFGISPAYLAHLATKQIRPVQSHNLSSLRSVLSTGSPLLGPQFEWFYDHFAKNVRLSSISGGTDILGCFALGNPTLPVYAGQMQCIALGMDVAFAPNSDDPASHVGELICRTPFPSAPTQFWGDSNNEKYKQAYFANDPTVWRHGDLGEITPQGGVVIHGRSDAVLNRDGVRIGTAELYRPLSSIDEVREAVAIMYEPKQKSRPKILLFVQLAADQELTSALTKRIRNAIVEHTSPRHAPNHIVSVTDLPRTRSGKLSELAVKDVIHERPVAQLNALANPDSLDAVKAAMDTLNIT